jgi:hypothetical protein
MSDRTAKPRIDILKYAPWLTDRRAALWAGAFCVVWIGMFLWNAAAGDLRGHDFIVYWSGARLAAQGDAARVYDLPFFSGYLKSVAGPAPEWNTYSYPPVAMLLTLPLAKLPFMAALLLWTVLGMSLCACTLSLQTNRRWAWRAALGSPAAFLNFMSGQNGYFTASLLGGGLALVERRPVWAGILLGLLCFKPQMGILVPVALLAGGHWRAFLSAAATVSVLVLSSIRAFGWASWAAFLGHAAVQRAIMEGGQSLWHRMPTVFCAVRLAGGGVMVAYGAQIASALLAGAVVIFLWRKKCDLSVRVAALALATFLATPYAWDYDMVVLTFAVAGLAWEGGKAGFLPWEKITWLAVVILPLPMMALAKLWGLPLGPPVLWLALLLVLRRGLCAGQKNSAGPEAGGLIAAG